MRLNEGCHYCEVSGSAIILDTQKDKYYFLPQRQSAIFASLLDRSHERLTRSQRLVAEKLIKSGILLADSCDGRPTMACDHKIAQNSLFDGFGAPLVMPDTRVAFGFFYSTVSMSILQHTSSLDAVVHCAKVWKSRALEMPRSSTEYVAKLTAQFNTIAPVMITLKNNCLSRSLILSKFLSLFQVPVDWVFGVRLAPFAAHCWLEFDGLILNDDAFFVHEYKPIMVV